MKRVRAYPPPKRHSVTMDDMPGILTAIGLFVGLCFERGWF
jgi:hypothetical protein